MHFETVLHSIHPYLPTTMAVDSRLLRYRKKRFIDKYTLMNIV
jgi:hypothetical protein